MRGARQQPRLATLVVCVVAIAAACSGGGSKGAGPSGTAGQRCPVDALAKTKQPVEITFWHSFTTQNNMKVLDDIIRRFHASQNEVRVRPVQIPAMEDTITKIKAGLSTGDLPDVAQVGDIYTQSMVDSGSTVPVQSCVDAEHYDLSDYIPRALEYYTTKGVLRALPSTVANQILYYDADMFEEAGLDPARPPRTLEQVREYSQRIVSAKVAPHGIAMRTEPYYVEFWFLKANKPLVDGANGREERATKVLLDTATGRAVFRWWRDMVDSGLALDSGPKSVADHLLAVARRDAAMTFESSAAMGPIRSVIESGQYRKARMMAAPFPGLAEGGGSVPGDSALWIIARSTPEKQAAAWKFVKFMGAPEQQALLHTGAGYVPIRKRAADLPDVRALWAKQPEWRVAYDQLLAGPSTPASAGAVIGDYQGVRDAIRDALVEMLSGRATPEQAIAGAQRRADAAIVAYNDRIGG